jgi:2-isopropylmalate synthase
MVIDRVPNCDKAILSAHCHNDLGLAVANTLAALSAGVAQVECTVNGIGERAGNAALEEVVMALKVRADRLPYRTQIDATQIVPSSELLSLLTGQRVQLNKAVVGQNAFAHEAGIHQDGLLKDRRTYEIMRAEDVGASPPPLVLGKHSGRRAVQQRCAELGIAVEGATLEEVYTALMTVADQQKRISDRDVYAVVAARTR